MVCFANPAIAGFGKPHPQLSASGKSRDRKALPVTPRSEKKMEMGRGLQPRLNCNRAEGLALPNPAKLLTVTPQSRNRHKAVARADDLEKIYPVFLILLFS